MDISPLGTLLSFATACLIIELTPGPNMAYLAVLSASDGRRNGFAAVAGIAAGLLIVGMVAALGVATVIINSAIAYQALRWGGVLYLLWLAWDGWQSGKETSPTKTLETARHLEFFKRGLITNLLNPKAAVFYVGILPSFLYSTSSIEKQTLILTFIYVSIASIIHCIIVLIADTAHGFFDNPKRIYFIRRALSLMLAGIALWFAWVTSTAL